MVDGVIHGGVAGFRAESIQVKGPKISLGLVVYGNWCVVSGALG